MKVLNLYAGLGGNRKLWENCEVTAVENHEKIAEIYQRLHPNDTVIVGDAHQFLLENHAEFDMVWTSPPCQTHSRMMKATRHKLNRYPDMSLYQQIIFLQHFFKGDYVVENVVPYYEPLIAPTATIGRHSFWSNLNLKGIEDVKRPAGFINQSNLAGKKALMDWLNIHYEENIEGDHEPLVQLVRSGRPAVVGPNPFEAGVDECVIADGDVFDSTGFIPPVVIAFDQDAVHLGRKVARQPV